MASCNGLDISLFFHIAFIHNVCIYFYMLFICLDNFKTCKNNLVAINDNIVCNQPIYIEFLQTWCD